MNIVKAYYLLVGVITGMIVNSLINLYSTVEIIKMCVHK